jgi:thioredoxin-like negative regulator of GroEL
VGSRARGLSGAGSGENSEVTPTAVTAGVAPVAEKPRLIFFYGKTSGPCRRVEAFLSQVLQRRHNHETFRLVRVCAESHPELIEHFRVETLPTIVVVEERRVKRRVICPRGRRELEHALAPWLH